MSFSTPTGAEQVLVHRVMVIHVELHHRHDASELRDEASEHARLVHQPQHDLRRISRRQDVEEHLVGLGSLRKVGPMSVQRSRREPRGVGVDRQVVLVGEPEQPDQVGGIALECVLVERH